MFEQTLESNRKVRLETTYPVVAGVDQARVPHLLATDVDGKLQTTAWSAFGVPPHNSIALTYVLDGAGAKTNNVHQAIYKKDGVTVATITLTYAGGGTSDDDLVTLASITVP